MKYLVALAVSAGILMGGMFATSAHAGIDPWADDSLCDPQARYYVGVTAWQGDLCNRLEVEQARLLNDVIEAAYIEAFGGSFFHFSSYPCSVNGNGYVNYGGLREGSPGARNVWFDANGVDCSVGSDRALASNPQVVIPRELGMTLAEYFDQFVKARGIADRVRAIPLTHDQLLSCVGTDVDCKDLVKYESILDFDQELVDKRYPLSAN